ncbi:unnamed protein product [Paramecium octaurelia]|uniref:RING-type domain-containing protein n=1 Tax=Paramecium octaurelia TaxID=43137 RepID=A0A8S1V0Z4_PAROT|nr:unnamed protein product [Paramecium octaurelia]
MIFLLCISSVLASFNTQYVTDQMEIQHTNLNSSRTYLLSLIITQYPKNNYCLPLLQVIMNNQIYNDSQAYSVRANVQKVYINGTESVIIKVNCNVLEYFQNQKNINKTMHFNLTLNDAKQHSSILCQFPHYGQNCSLSILQIQKEFSVTILILNSTWLYAYAILDNNDYEIIVQNGESLFGVSIVSINKLNVTVLPSFLQNFVVLEQTDEEKEIQISRTEDDQDNVYVIGLFNFNSTQIQEITITLTAGFKSEEFPFWVTMLLISIIVFGMLLLLIILLLFRRQYKKLTQIKPALDKKVIMKYMPPQKADSKMIKDTCSICLVQFELKDKFCQTPCRHVFHEQCLVDWTTKQANCPVCRQGLLEKEINELMEIKNNRNRKVKDLNIEEALKSKDDAQSQTYRNFPLLQLSSSPFRTQLKIELDCSPQAEHSPPILQFEGSPENLTNRNLCFQSDGIVESQN